MICPDEKGSFAPSQKREHPFAVVVGQMGMDNIDTLIEGVPVDGAVIIKPVIQGKVAGESQPLINREDPFRRLFTHGPLAEISGCLRIGEAYFYPLSSQALAQGDHGLRRARPFPVAEEMEAFHRE
jgi:hypothetical protein